MVVLGDLKALEGNVLALLKLPEQQEMKTEKVELSTEKLDFLQKVKKEEIGRIQEAEKRNLNPFEERKMEEIATTIFVEKVVSEMKEEEKRKLMEKSIRGLKDVVSTAFDKGNVVVKLKQGMLELSVNDLILESVQDNFDALKKILFKD